MSRTAEFVRLETGARTRAAAAAPSLWVALGLAMGCVVCVGLARFAYSLLLPDMQADLHWSYAQAGTLNAAISVGYLVGALLTPRVEALVGSRRGFLGAMLLVAAGLFATALFRDLPALLALRFVTGLALGPIFICGFGLAARAGALSGRSTLFTGLYGAGVGLGIVLSGVLLPPLLVSADHWPWGWIVLGVVAFVVTLIAVPAVRRSPASGSARVSARTKLRKLMPLMLAIFGYGAGYFALVTFLVAYLRASGYGETRILEFWITAGLVLMVSMFFWGKVLTLFRGGWGVALITAMLIVSALMLLLWHGELAVLLSSVLFGASVLASGLAHYDFARRLTPPEDWTRVTAALTATFCLGQVLGPVFCGWLSDANGLRAGMFVAMGLLVLCIVAVLFQRHVAE